MRPFHLYRNPLCKKEFLIDAALYVSMCRFISKILPYTLRSSFLLCVIEIVMFIEHSNAFETVMVDLIL